MYFHSVVQLDPLLCFLPTLSLLSVVAPVEIAEAALRTVHLIRAQHYAGRLETTPCNYEQHTTTFDFFSAHTLFSRQPFLLLSGQRGYSTVTRTTHEHISTS